MCRFAPPNGLSCTAERLVLQAETAYFARQYGACCNPLTAKSLRKKAGGVKIFYMYCHCLGVLRQSRAVGGGSWDRALRHAVRQNGRAVFGGFAFLLYLCKWQVVPGMPCGKRAIAWRRGPGRLPSPTTFYR